MKRILLATIAGLALSTSGALAANLGLPYKAPPPPPAATWTGCYLDAGVGYGMWNADHFLEDTATTPVTQVTASTTSGGRGWLGRLGAGCDYQIASRFVVGVFGDYDFMDIHGTIGEFIAQGEAKQSGAWGVGGRIGYLVTPSVLTYFDGGYTEARSNQIDLNSITPPFAPIVGVDIGAHTYNGWFIGGGTEYALRGIVPIPGLFWRTEYRYASYQAADLPIVGAPIGFTEHVQPTVQTITSGLVWRFNWTGR